MKTVVKIVGTLLLLVGVVGIMVFGSRIKVKIPQIEPYHMEEQVDIKGIQKIKIQPEMFDVQVVQVDQGDLRAVLDGYRMMNDQIDLMVNKINNQAVIKIKSTTKGDRLLQWFAWARKRHPEHKLVIYVPKQQYEQIQVESSHGQVVVKDITHTKEFSIGESNSGMIQVDHFKGDLLAIKGYDSSVEMNDVQAKIEVDIQSGTITGEQWKGSLIDLRTDYGNIDVKGIDGKILAELETGEIQLKRLVGNYDHQIHNEMGNVNLSYLTPPSQIQFDLLSEMGEIKLNLPGAMKDANQNDSMEPGDQLKGFIGKPGEGPYLRVTTETGSIQIQ